MHGDCDISEVSNKIRAEEPKDLLVMIVDIVAWAN